MSTLNIRLCQLNFYPSEIEYNTELIVTHINTAEDTDILVFPEMATWKPLKSDNLEEIPDSLLFEKQINLIEKSSKNKKVRAIIGTLFPTKKGVENRAYLLGEKERQYYTKTHIHWTEAFVPGNSLPILQCCGSSVGCLICYDLAFPEAARVLSLHGAQILFVPSAVPNTFSQKYVRSRLQGLSILNQFWIVYVNRCDDGFHGYSSIYSPRGECIVEADSSEQIINTTIDLDEVIKWQKEERVIPFRRPELYRDIIEL
ncbi:MAG: hypothetical protein GF353_08455 [Candidatus Lokiarchaeota archaeon]|nr:hypothetical protein [Candidatus Lokiarchaeota archaeon]